jgi:acyl carrier protein
LALARGKLTDDMDNSPAATTPSIAQLLKRCRPEVIAAAEHYRQSPDVGLLPVIVLGVFERFMEPERRELLQKPSQVRNELALQADLGMDSLVMVEVVMTLEEVLSAKIPDEELRSLVTVGDALAYLQAKSTGAALPVPPDPLMNEMLPMLLPGQVPMARAVVLRQGSIQGTWASTELPTDDNLMAMAKQLVEIWCARRQVSFSINPVRTASAQLDPLLPVQLIALREKSGWVVYLQQTAGQRMAIATL